MQEDASESDLGNEKEPRQDGHFVVLNDRSAFNRLELEEFNYKCE